MYDLVSMTQIKRQSIKCVQEVQHLCDYEIALKAYNFCKTQTAVYKEFFDELSSTRSAQVIRSEDKCFTFYCWSNAWF